jgi:hypothetical protein
MALTKIRGNTQIKSSTITNVEIAANAGIELSKLAEGAELIKRDGSVAFTGDVNLGSHKITNLAAPTQPNDAVRKAYVDSEVAAVQAEVDAEELARAAADTVLQGNIDAEAAARAAADTALSIDIDAEAAARAAADTTLQGNIDAEAATRLANDNTLQDNIDAEAAARAAADTALDGRMTDAEADIVVLDGRMDTAEADIDALESRASTLENGLQAETSARIADVDAEEARALAAEAAIQAELDASQVGAGLNSNGSYSAIAGSNYLKSADFVSAGVDASLKNADKLLDAAVKAEVDARIADVDAEQARAEAAEAALGVRIDNLDADSVAAVAAVQAELDATQVGAGLGVDGSYSAHAGSTYIKSADFVSAGVDASLHNADKLLDAAIKAEVDARIADVDAEEARALAAEGVLQDNIDAVAADLAAEEAARIADVDAEQARAEAAEGVLQDNIDAEEAARIAGDAATLASANSYTDQKITDLVAGAPELLDTLNELAAAIGDDENFVTTVTNMVADANAAVDAEEARAMAAEAALGVRIDGVEADLAAEEAARIADVDAEETRALAAEGVLQDNIDAEEARALAAEGVLQANIDAEEARAMAAEAALQAELDASQVGAGLGVDGSYSAHAGSNYIKSADFATASLTASLHNADKMLDAALKAEVDARIADVDAEQARAEAAEAVLDGRLDALEPRMDTAEGDIVALEGRMDTAEGDIVALEGRMDSAEGRLDDLESLTVYIADVVTRETPSGAVDGSNQAYTLAHSIVLGSEQVFLNGLLQEPGVGNDYTIASNVITMNAAPITNDRIRVTYLKA